MKTKSMASCAVITRDPPASRRLFVEALGLPLETSAGDDYAHSEHIEGVKHFGVWPLCQAAQACFGTRDWPKEPWGQTVARLQAPEGPIIGISYTPRMHN